MDSAKISQNSHLDDNANIESENNNLTSIENRKTHLKRTAEVSEPASKRPKLDHHTSPNASRTASKENNTTSQRICSACLEKCESRVLHTPCGHFYCRECTTRLIVKSTHDEELFPPQCCQTPIPMNLIEQSVEPTLIAKLREKEMEFTTDNRTYCNQTTCSTFIPPSHISGDTGTCAACGHKTCTICKAREHSGTDCPEDPLMQQMQDMARARGWQTCYACHRLVELNTGCNHITCPCSAEFCYVCGAQWNTCECPLWEEANIFPRAEHVHHGVQEALGQLRLVDVCDHERWRYIGGPRRCESCRQRVPRFIFECRLCHTRACVRCRRNMP